MTPVVKAGIVGIVIAIVLIFILPTEISFINYFVASVIAIYVFRLKETKDGVLVALGIFVITEWIVGSLGVLALFALNETVTLTADISTVISQILTTLFALLAGLVGPALASRQRTEAMLPPIPMPPPFTSPTPTQPVPEVKPQEKKFCPYCGAEQKPDAAFCEKCGKKIA